MKSIIGRVIRLERERAATQNEDGETLADIIWRRRQRRREAEGLPPEERPQFRFSGVKSLAEVMRLCRKQRMLEGGQ